VDDEYGGIEYGGLPVWPPVCLHHNESRRLKSPLEGSQKSLSDGRPCRLNDLREQSGGASRAPSLREPG